MNMKKKILTLLVLLMTAVTGAWAQEQSETIATTAKIVEGTHFTISNNGKYADEEGMNADGGITVTPKNGETITKVVISCTFTPEYVHDGNTSVSSGTKEITNEGETITVTGVNASTFTFTCSNSGPMFGQFVVYYTEAPAAPAESIDLTTTDNLTWTLASMPGYDVELEVEYYPLATLATLPAAAEGVVEGTDAALLTPGTSAEGTLAYAIGTSEAPTGQWSEAIPTAQDLEAGEYYVWYKVVGDAEHSDSQPQSIAVTIAEAPTYAVTIDDAGVDASNWQATPAEQRAGQTVTLSYGGKKKIRSITIEKAAAAAPSYDNTLNINTYDPELNNWENVTVPTGKHWLITGTGEATTNVITIANNATVTLSGVNITAYGRSITCVGNATIILADGTTNNLYSAEGEYGAAGIEMSGGSGTSLTIQGNTGVLNITSGSGPAIGAGYGHAGCAINIEGGIINATSTDGPGIGAAYTTACGNITISGGTVAATGGYGCPGIGGASSANCGDITITSGVTSVTATKGSEAPYSIGASSSGSCGTVTIEDESKVTQQ